MTDTTDVGEVSYSVRICSRCGGRLIGHRPRLRLTRWACEACGRRSR